ncbi:hypothetical protein N657DRAFT_638863 [Parathielavia appendiculata]|uniref:Uncharacterized protein n=1 Tax=Parathielavia appendiculata TaxID=2587402 RepID=A0AAN6Z8P1_9PEZI|nr:hypothetical protein N657DRAFT_638863 [Parathielavia appendiculata]
MPGLTIDTGPGAPSAAARGTTANPRHASPTSRASSPPRPPVSPITPMLAAAQLPGASPAGNTTHNAPDDFALGRPVFTHTSQTDQVGIAPPPAQPIDFDSNPDVLALKSAISILQLQRARATADLQSLRRAKEAALANPEAFAADLAAGNVRVEGDPLFSPRTRAGGVTGDHFASDSSSTTTSDDDDDGEAEAEEPETEAPTDNSTTRAEQSPEHRAPKQKPKPKPKHRQKGKHTSSPPAPPWQTLPKPQSIVRCPPINWAQYGVVGESLDKLHSEQLAAPIPGTPMILGPGGTYDPSATGAAGGGGGRGGGAQVGEQPRRLVGIAAPYNPLRDKVEKKGKGGKR